MYIVRDSVGLDWTGLDWLYEHSTYVHMYILHSTLYEHEVCVKWLAHAINCVCVRVCVV